MILIIDSGSTKSDMKWLQDGTIVYSQQIAGINPFFQTVNDIDSLLSDCCPKEIANGTLHVFHYGAGCSFTEKCEIVRNALHRRFPKATIEIANDLLGAARSLFHTSKGIACILGTGSNSCYYDGTNICKNVSPLGFILGDEGSGAVIGKLFISDILKGMAPKDVIQQFFEESNTSPSEIMDHVYKQSFPNRFLAQQTKFIYTHKSDPYYQQLLVKCFDSFFARNINQYDVQLPIRCIGSIAYYFQDELKEAANLHHRTIECIEQSPMQGLISFHSQTNN